MIADVASLSSAMADGDARLEPLGERHREALRAACAADGEIWEIYPRSFEGDHFDPSFDAITDAPGRIMFAAFLGDTLVGMTGYLNIVPAHRGLEIGTTYLMPHLRGSGLNRRFKAMLLNRAFDAGFHRVEFRVDARNTRSQAAIAKLGAVREGLLRYHMITWTGHVRDTVVFSILKDEWR